uniref:hypothetical protein n=1 Tax=Salmonella enterica TaxID=28901 RepID=UPI003297D507
VQGEADIQEIRPLILSGAPALVTTPGDATHVPRDFADHCYRLAHVARATLAAQSFAHQARVRELTGEIERLQRQVTVQQRQL